MRHTKKEKQIHCQEIKQTTEPNTEMTLMLELSDRDARITMINMLKDLEEKITMQKDLDNMYEQMGDFSRDMETISETKRENKGV